MKYLKLLPSHFSPLTSQNGFAFIAIIMIVIVIFSVTLVSGAKKFELSPPEPAEEEEENTNPTTTPGAEVNPWDINFTITNCTSGVATGTITAQGSANGYVTLEIEDTPGNFSITSSDAFTSPNDNLELILKSSDGYDESKWRLRLFEGGAGTKDNYTGGTERASIPGNPTACS